MLHHRRIACGLACLLVLLVAPLDPGGRGRTRPNAQEAAGWTVSQGPRYTVSHPAGWTVGHAAAEGYVTLDGPGGERLMIWPFFLPTAATSSTAGLGPDGAGRVLDGLSRRVTAQVAWQRSQPLGPDGLKWIGRHPAGEVVASAVWRPTPRGVAGVFYMALAPHGAYRGVQDVFARILGSFRIVGGQAAAAPAADAGGGLRFVPWQDPLEGAFALEVPAGWSVEGGMVRRSALQVQPSVWMRSPPEGGGGGATTATVFIGDGRLPTFVEPTPMLNWTGFPEGSTYSPGYGEVMVVLRFHEGSRYAEAYANDLCGGTAGLAQVRQRGDIDAFFRELYRRHGVAFQRMSVGEAAFECRGGRGYVLAGTMLMAMPGIEGGVWSVPMLWGYHAPPERVEAAQAALRHALASFRVNPDWSRAQQGTTAAVSGIARETADYVSNIISDTYWSNAATQDEIARRRSNQTLGLVDVVDPQTGEQRQVESGSNYYWIANDGTVVGTNLHATPDPRYDFRELIALP